MSGRPDDPYADVIAVLAVDAHIAPWDARNRLTIADAQAILDLLQARADADQKGR